MTVLAVQVPVWLLLLVAVVVVLGGLIHDTRARADRARVDANVGLDAVDELQHVIGELLLTLDDAGVVVPEQARDYLDAYREHLAEHHPDRQPPG